MSLLLLFNLSSTAHSKELTDSLTISEIPSLQSVIERTFADSLSIEESIFFQSIINKNITDNLTITDELTFERTIIRQVQDSLLLSDTLVSKEAYKNLSDEFITSEQLSKEINKRNEDSLTLSDLFEKICNKNLLISDVLPFTDSLLKEYGFNRSFEDSIIISDNQLAYLDRILKIIVKKIEKDLIIVSQIRKGLRIISEISFNFINFIISVFVREYKVKNSISKDLFLKTKIHGK